MASSQTTKRPRAQCSESSSDLGLYVGAGDENRTRTISLGMSAAGSTDLRSRWSSCTSSEPRLTIRHRVRPTDRARSGHGASAAGTMLGMAKPIEYRWRGAITDAEMVALVQAHSGHAVAGWWDQVRPHSLGWVTARLRGGARVGFVNVAWDGGDHAFRRLHVDPRLAPALTDTHPEASPP
jgi:hypothetical protein